MNKICIYVSIKKRKKKHDYIAGIWDVLKLGLFLNQY